MPRVAPSGTAVGQLPDADTVLAAGSVDAGLETLTADAAQWALTERVVEPDPVWAGPMQDRYARFLELGRR